MGMLFKDLWIGERGAVSLNRKTWTGINKIRQENL